MVMNGTPCGECGDPMRLHSSLPFHVACRPITPALATSLDHVVPISKGGQHTKDNLVPACAYCNGSKNDRPLLVWMATRRAA